MLNGYKIIGVCATKLHDEFCSGFLQALCRRAIDKDYRLFVFNSFVDFYHGDRYEQGAKSIYKMINFDKLDALVIIDHCFYDKDLVRELIGKAQAKKIPVVVLYGRYDGCFSIIKNYREVYKDLIYHVIKIHNAKRLYFIAGLKGEENSDLRLKCFRQVMAENNLEIPEGAIVYGDYWSGPVKKAVDKWVIADDIPDAIICANDDMADTVCDHLMNYGISVPEDVIVTGFDGLTSLSFRKPRLTTCAQDVAGTARLCFNIVKDAIDNGTKPYIEEEKFNIVFSESCGCGHEDEANYRKKARHFYRMLEDVMNHEETIYMWADRINDSTDINVIGRNLTENIFPGSCVGINSNLLSIARKKTGTDHDHPFTEKIVVISSKDNDSQPCAQEVFELDEMYPRLSECISEKVMFVFQSIYAADEVCGYYMAKMTNIENDAAKLRRLCRITNLEFSVIISRIRQEHITKKIHTRDALTGLINLKGLVANIKERYYEYSKKYIAVSVYAIPQYKFIMENYGLEDTEEAVTMAADALQLANPDCSLVARISEDEFVIVNLVDTSEQIGETINHATSAFFKIIEENNSRRDRDYYVEVNCGCVVSSPGWENDIMSFIKAASGEMYLNRLKNGKTPVLKKETQYKEFYRVFDLLVEKNLFIYHFQPIVDAHTGEVYAYEALMRTDKSINLNPGQILDIADEYHRMYDIEKATLFNVMSYIDTHREQFGNRRIFINSIPGCFLNQEDNERLIEKFGHLFDRCTIEITEQNETNDAELMQIKRLEINGQACQIAIDDYGTGFSNIVNLLRYEPQVIKIDRYLITDVHKDANKQHFISSTIDFARLNDILVLAEGVETEDELSKVIELGADLIQGFYTARPSAEVLTEIKPEIKQFIQSKSAELKAGIPS